MSRTRPPQVAFSSGEIDPLMHNRFDYQRFQTGLAKCTGFLPLAQGGFTRAPGTWYRGQTKDNAPAVLIPFQFAADDALILEFTANLMRVWRYGALIQVAGLPYELATPFGADALPSLRWVQSADVIYLVDGIHPVQRLSRLALDHWTITPQVYDLGPFRVQNLDVIRTLTPSGASGTINLVASADLFTAAHVGSLIEILPSQDNIVPVWQTDDGISVGDMRRYGDNYYALTAGTRTGNSPPIHTEGEAMTSPGITWQWLSDGTGVVRITAVTDATHAAATVLRPLSPALTGLATYRWSEGAWSDVYGYPSALELYDQRLVGAATPSEPRTIWFSAIGDFADFKPSTEADGSFAYTIAGTGSINRVINIQRGRAGLHIFALGEEYSSRSESRAAAIGPTTAVFGLDGSVGSCPARPVAPAGNPIFISRDKRRVMMVAYNLQSDANEVRNLSRAAQHLGEEQFEQIVWQGAPEPIAWLRRGNGDLVAMIYDESEEVLGWATIPLAGGFVESLAMSPDPTGKRDILTLVVSRTFAGITTRSIEELAPTWISQPDSVETYEACHLYNALRFAPDSPTNEFPVPHLPGQQVHVWTGAATIGPLMVSAEGMVTTEETLTHAIIGLLDATHRARTLDIQAAAPDGNSLGRNKRTSTVTLGVYRSMAGFAQMIESGLMGERASGAAKFILPQPALAGDLVERSGVTRLPLPSGLAMGVAVEITPDGGAPLTITAIVPEIEETGA